MNTAYPKRIDQVQRIPGVDAVALVPGANLRYFTGLDLHLSERPIVAFFSAQGLSIILPELELPQLDARPDLAAKTFVWTDEAGYLGAFEGALEALGLRGGTLGVDGMTMRVSEWLAFTQLEPSLRVRAVERDLIALRARKEPHEVEAVRRAVRLSEAALHALVARLRPGLTERDIALQLTDALYAAGSEGLAFPPLVQTGPNSALPHGAVGERALREGEPLLIDFGGVKDGYPADLTRTFCLGEPKGELARIHETVLEANRAAIAAVKPGVPMGEIDRAAREVIAAAGYGERFIHRTGHGLGLEVHESIPQLAAGVTDPLEVGMVFTVEPGVYLPGFGGVRLEDDVVVTASGAEVLSEFPHALSGGS